MRPFDAAAICSSVHPIAYAGMCGKLPAGCPACVPSGRFAAASGSGVPHHGGPIAARASPAPSANVSKRRAQRAAHSPSPHLNPLSLDGPAPEANPRARC